MRLLTRLDDDYGLTENLSTLKSIDVLEELSAWMLICDWTVSLPCNNIDNDGNSNISGVLRSLNQVI